jgi:hypothetical protein
MREQVAEPLHQDRRVGLGLDGNGILHRPDEGAGSEGDEMEPRRHQSARADRVVDRGHAEGFPERLGDSTRHCHGGNEKNGRLHRKDERSCKGCAGAAPPRTSGA